MKLKISQEKMSFNKQTLLTCILFTLLLHVELSYSILMHLSFPLPVLIKT